jgi:LmbE family N-acetylglucosaminyl deacetylase
MCVAAHPDDEDGTTLTVLRRKYGVHTVSLFSTYGEGGQNAVGPDLYEELGVIRAQETLKAAQIQGSEPYFLGLKDFGYSKSAEEAFKFWNHDEALKRMVRKIRELRPDVIITNHDTTTGHGHHQATGRLLLEAFTAAADAKSFPEQVGQLGTWQVKRIFVRARRSSTEPQPTADKLVVVDPNEVDQLRGTMFGEQALTALQQHASQGPWPKTVAAWLRAQNNQTGKLNLIRYRLERESPVAPPLPNNPKTFLDGLKLSEGTAATLAPPMIDERPLTEFLDQPDRILDALIIWKRLRPSLEGSAEDAHRFRLISALRSTALAIASGVSLTISSLDDALVPGTSTRFSVDAANSGNRLVKLNKLTLDAWTENARLEAADQIVPDSETTVAIERTTPKTAAVTVPKAEHLYDGRFLGQLFTARAEFELDGSVFSLTKELYLDIVPPVEIKSISPSPCVRTPQAPDHCKSFDVSLANHLKSPFKGTINATRSSSGIIQNGNQVQLQSLESRFVQATDLNSNSQPAKLSPSEESAIEMISVIASGSGQPVTQRAVRISFAAARVTPRLRVGYIPSFDRTLELTLAAMGVEAKELTIQDIQRSELDSFDTIIIDNRGYEAHPELIPTNSRLLEYVSNGGNLIVFYHKDNEWNPDEKRNRPQLAPYPILLDDNRVTDETAPIRFLRPAHRLLNYPNRITATDFKNWIQERGLYYPKEWDPRYTPIFSTADPGEAELTGGLLVANYGKGTYIYTSMVWYRQLRAGIPGAYRVFANMISYGRKVRGR